MFGIITFIYIHCLGRTHQSVPYTFHSAVFPPSHVAVIIANHCTIQHTIVWIHPLSSDEHQDRLQVSAQLESPYLTAPFLDVYEIVCVGVCECVCVCPREDFLGHMVLTFNWTNYSQGVLQNDWGLRSHQLSIMITILPTFFHIPSFIKCNGHLSKWCLMFLLFFCNFWCPAHYWLWVSSIGFLVVFKLLIDILHSFLF